MKRPRARGWRPFPKHLQCDVQSVMDLCLYWPGKMGVAPGEFPEVLSALNCIAASCTPGDELRYWVAFYESFRLAAGLPRYSLSDESAVQAAVRRVSR